MNQALSAALSYGARGWRVLPVIGKIPTLRDWPTKASIDPEQIRAWWTQQPMANVGIATGTQSQLLVLDVDPDKGGDDSLRKLEAQHGPLPMTIEVITGSGGHHYYFQHPGIALRNSAGKLGSGLDIRTEGGQVVAPPSVHPDTGRLYEWEGAHHPDDIAPAHVPGWLLRLLTAKRDITTVPASQTFQDGNRNDSLTREAGRLRRIGLSQTELHAALLAMNQERCRPPLSDDEVQSIAGSIARYSVVPGAAPFWPILDHAALHGLAGEVVRLIAPHTEADSVALLVSFLAEYGAMLNRGPHLILDGSYHPCFSGR